MKTMKSYRIDDTILGMINKLKKDFRIKTDTGIIEYAIMNLYYETYTKMERIRASQQTINEDLLDKWWDQC